MAFVTSCGSVAVSIVIVSFDLVTTTISVSLCSTDFAEITVSNKSVTSFSGAFVARDVIIAAAIPHTNPGMISYNSVLNAADTPP